jgi:hypothetical protein
MARSSSRAAKTYPSKVDAWLVGLMAFSMAMAFLGATLAAIQAGPMRVAQAFLILLTAAGFVVWVFIGTSYTLAGRELQIRSGPFRWRIQLDEINGIEPVARQSVFLRMRSSPALSMDRIAISYAGGKRIMISPADKQAFLKDIESRKASA